MNDALDSIEQELGPHGKAWRAVYNAHLKSPAALSGVASRCGAFGAVPFALQLRASGKGAMRDGAVLTNLYRLAEALTLAIEPVTQHVDNVMDRPLFTGVPEVVKQ